MIEETMQIKIFLILILSCSAVYGQSDKYELNLPVIETDEVQLTPTENKETQEYMLRITLPDSERTEFISLDSKDAVVLVQGSINTYYSDSNNNLVVNYVADKNGYRASYRFGTSVEPQPLAGPTFDTRLSGSDLKSLAG